VNKRTTALLVISAFIAGGLLAPVAVNAAQKVFDPTGSIDNNTTPHYLKRFDDPDFQVKCWSTGPWSESGISCIPWSEIKER
jgi:hypothetical protein